MKSRVEQAKNLIVLTISKIRWEQLSLLFTKLHEDCLQGTCINLTTQVKQTLILDVIS